MVSNFIDIIVWVAISDQTDLGYLGGGGGADRLRGDGLGTQQHSWLSLCKGVYRLWERHLLNRIKALTWILVNLLNYL